jgi:hypothetical protein
MFRFILSASLLSGVFAITQPAFADPRVATTSDASQFAAPSAQPVPPASVLPSSNLSTKSSSGFGKDIVPVGFGWG